MSGDAIVGSVFTANWLNENTISYDKEFNEKNKINAVAGFTAQVSESKGAIAEAAGFATDAFEYNNLATGITNVAPRSLANKWSLASYLGRINYIFDERYLFTLTLRADGLVQIWQRQQMGLFPLGSHRLECERREVFSAFQKDQPPKTEIKRRTDG